MDRGGRHTTGWYSRWWSTLVKIIVLYLCLHSCSDKFCNCQIPEVTKEEYENRTPEEWRENWLVDTIWTCHGAELQRMGELACLNDPRKISLVKRSNSERELFLPAKLAKAFLNYRHRKDSRRRRTGKDEECCAEVQGCRWEELGEYCTLHSRAYHQSGDQP